MRSYLCNVSIAGIVNGLSISLNCLEFIKTIDSLKRKQKGGVVMDFRMISKFSHLCYLESLVPKPQFYITIMAAMYILILTFMVHISNLETPYCKGD